MRSSRPLLPLLSAAGVRKGSFVGGEEGCDTRGAPTHLPGHVPEPPVIGTQQIHPRGPTPALCVPRPRGRLHLELHRCPFLVVRSSFSCSICPPSPVALATGNVQKVLGQEAGNPRHEPPVGWVPWAALRTHSRRSRPTAAIPQLLAGKGDLCVCSPWAPQQAQMCPTVHPSSFSCILSWLSQSPQTLHKGLIPTEGK